RTVDSLSEHLSEKWPLCASKCFFAEHLIKEPRGCLTRQLDCRPSAGQRECSEMARSPISIIGGKKEFAAPDGSIASISRTIPGYAKGWRIEIVFSHAGHHMRPMVLDTFDLGPTEFTDTFRVFSRCVVGMKIRRDYLGTALVQCLKIANHATEGVECFFRFQ